MERRFCQSCGMPLGDETLLGMESAGKMPGILCLLLVKGRFPPGLHDGGNGGCLSYSRKEGGTEQPCLTRETMLRWFST